MRIEAKEEGRRRKDEESTATSTSSSFSLYPSSFRVAIVGGGYAGLAAAVELASNGISVRVFEAGPTLGGRARRIAYQNISLDNGAHILLGAYRETLRVMHIAGVANSAVLRMPLTLTIKDRLHISAASLPPPFAFIGGTTQRKKSQLVGPYRSNSLRRYVT